MGGQQLELNVSKSCPIAVAEIQGVSVGVRVRVCRQVQVGNVVTDFCRELGAAWLWD